MTFSHWVLGLGVYCYKCTYSSGVGEPQLTLTLLGLRISDAETIFTKCYGFEHFLTSTMPRNPNAII